MEPTTQAQFDRTNILMKEFVDTVFSFYNNIKEQDVCQMADEQTLEKIRKQSIPQQGRPVEEVYREMLSDIYPNPDKPEKFILYIPPLCYSKEKGGFPLCYLRINTLIKFTVSLPVMTA